jgi:choline dehydrogenase-like flavoprotein
VPSRLSILTRPHNGRAACHYCSQCGRGCSTHSNFSSPSVLIPPAMKTGTAEAQSPTRWRARLRRRLSAWPSGVTYVTRTTSRDNHVRARIVVVAGSACESARILLNSKSAKFPQGLGATRAATSAST